jgi:thymidylate synthase (FAD)
MKRIATTCKELEEIGVPREDSALLLPLGMTTKIVDKRNLRNLVDMSRQRKCMRAYWEYRELFADLEKALKDYSNEWAWIVDNLFKRKCDVLGYCTEKKSCGYKK